MEDNNVSMYHIFTFLVVTSFSITYVIIKREQRDGSCATVLQMVYFVDWCDDCYDGTFCFQILGGTINDGVPFEISLSTLSRHGPVTIGTTSVLCIAVSFNTELPQRLCRQQLYLNKILLPPQNALRYFSWNSNRHGSFKWNLSSTEPVPAWYH